MRRALGLTVLAAFAACSPSYGESDRGDPDSGVRSDSGDVPNGDGGSGNDAGSGIDGGPDSAPPTSRSALYAAAVLADQPLAFFRFEETTGDKLKDEVGSHEGTAFGPPNLVAPGLFGATDGMQLPQGSKAHVRVSGTDARFTSTQKFTIEAWVYPKLFSNYQWIVSTEQTASPRNGWSVFGNSGAGSSFELWNADGALSLYMTAKPLVVDKWQHLVFTYNGFVLAGYLDGIKIQSVNVTLTFPDTGDLTFGCRLINGAPNECLEGWSLDEIAFYGAPLTEQRIKAHYDLGAPK